MNTRAFRPSSPALYHLDPIGGDADGEPDALFHVAEDPHERRDVMEQYPERATQMRHELLALVGAATAGKAPGEPRPVSPALRERLRQLGYEN